MVILHRLFVALLMASLIGLAGCDVRQTSTTPMAPKPRPAAPQPKVMPRSQASLEMADYFAQRQSVFLMNDLLRVGGGGPDTPFNQRNLVDNFIRIAVYDEYVTKNNQLSANATETYLRRWNSPIHMKVEFGTSVPLSQRTEDLASIRKYTKRLSRLIGLQIRLTDEAPNFYVLIMDEDERKALGPYLKELVPEMPTATLNLSTNMGRETFCMVSSYSTEDDTSTYFKSVVVIRGEHPDLLRLSCIHEELAQGLGLSNDDRYARPSIFNDDQEFALLTRHDELLLQMLYDKRLHAGMTEEQARPIAKIIAAELLGGTS